MKEVSWLSSALITVLEVPCVLVETRRAEIFASWFSIESKVSLKIELLVLIELYMLRNCLVATSLDCVSFRTRELSLVDKLPGSIFIGLCPLERVKPGGEIASIAKSLDCVSFRTRKFILVKKLLWWHFESEILVLGDLGNE